MFHKFSTEHIDSYREKVFIDGNQIRSAILYGYTRVTENKCSI